MTTTGHKRHRIVFLSLIQTQRTQKPVGNSRTSNEINARSQFMNDHRIDQVSDGIVNNEKTCGKNEGAFYGRRNKFCFAMAIRMIHIAWLRSYIKTVQA